MTTLRPADRRRMPSFATAGLVAAALFAGAAVAAPHTFQITREAAGVQQADAASLCAALGPGSCTIGVETFDSRSSGSFGTDFGITSGYTITGQYSDVTVDGAGIFGGAAGTGRYASTFSSSGYSLDLTTTNPDGINYFGFWLSALDRGNQLAFYSGGELVFSFAPTDVDAIVGGQCPGNAYCDNPNGGLGSNGHESYVFLNFFDKTGTFDRIVFFESPQVGGYESDNHTVGYVTGDSGTPVDVPLPGTLVLAGIGLAALTLAGLHRRLRPQRS
ncbi:MAG: PEP-CTERM sorting domain-containing protein [Burkholderiaceae bacterium]